MRIGIIGSGNVGGALGTRFARGGHTVIFGSREPGSEKMRDLLAKVGPNAKAVPVGEVVRESDLVVLSTPWNGTQEAVSLAGDLLGKIVIDTTNPVSPDLNSLTVGNTSSAGELVAQWAKGAKVVKAFNTVGNNVMEDSKFPQAKAVMFYCGDDEGAKKAVAGLIAELGFEPQDAGPLTQARLLEAFALLWITLAFKQGLGREIAFQFMKRKR
jgi:NADPH-dependent F420 reductase